MVTIMWVAACPKKPRAVGFEGKSNFVQSPVATAHKTEHNLSQLATSVEKKLQSSPVQ